jgi:polysaccharide biosynthesis protein PslH
MSLSSPKRLRIILVMIEPPLPFGNAAARWFYVLLNELVARGHQVTAFATCSNPKDIAQAKALFPEPTYDLRCYPIVPRSGLKAKLETLQRPYSYLFSQKFKQDLAAELTHSYDVLHLEQLWSGWLGLEYPAKALMNIHYLFSLDGAFSGSHNLETWLRNQMSNRAERFLLKSFPQIITLTDRLQSSIQAINPKADVHVVPLGLDLSLYPFQAELPEHSQPTVSLIGSLNWAPTFSAAERLITHLWPEIQRQVPHARLQIVGRKAKETLASFAHTPNLELHQDVPDTLPYFQNTDVLLYAPVAGSGMKVKVMEAFALGTPVVTTAEGIEGLPAQDGVHAGICEENSGLIERTVKLLQKAEQRQNQRLKARHLIETYCSPAATVDQLERAYQSIL